MLTVAPVAGRESKAIALLARRAHRLPRIESLYLEIRAILEKLSRCENCRAGLRAGVILYFTSMVNLLVTLYECE